MVDYLDKIFPSMVQYLPEQETQNFKFEHFEVTEEEVRHCQLLDAIHGRSEYRAFKPGTYVRLIRKNVSFNNIIMSDTWMEKSTNYDVYLNATGDVLIAGLGIGMVLLGIQNKKEVKSIIVVEKEQEIMDIVKDNLPLNGKVTIVCADIFDYQSTQKFDTIYFDIWDYICGDNWKDIVKLQRKFQGKRNKGSWCSSWRKEDFREAYRRSY
jgi:hypothetical protein